MADVTLEKILEDARALSSEDRKKLVSLLIASDEPPQPHKPLEQIAREQGKHPVDFDELLKLGEFFPEEESVDELVSAVGEWRRDSSERRIE